jgi:hypothetical protein
MSNGNGNGEYRELKDYRGGLIRQASAWLIWARHHRDWICVGGAETYAAALELRGPLGGELVLKRGEHPTQYDDGSYRFPRRATR